MHSAQGQIAFAKSNTGSTGQVLRHSPIGKGLLLLATTALTGTLGAGAAHAACTADFCWNVPGGIWSAGANWTPGGPPTTANTVIVGNGGTATVDNTNAQSGAADIGGNSSVVISPGGTWTSAGTIDIGDTTGSGTLTVNGGTLSASGQHMVFGFFGSSASSMLIENGGTVISTGGVQIGSTNPGSTSSATIVVTGAGSSWNIGTNNLDLENPGTSTGVTVANGASFTSGQAIIGGLATAGTNNNVLVTGAGTTWNSGTIVLGNVTGGGAGSSTGTFMVTNGAQVSVGGTAGGNVVIGFGIDGGGGRMDTFTVDGAGSKLTATATLYAGYSGTGALVVSNGGVVSDAAGIIIGHNAGSSGTVNIGAEAGQAAVAPGTIVAPSIQFGTGGGTVVFNHTSTNYAFSIPIQGLGAVDVESGTTILTATNSYTGATTINGGTLDVAGAINGSSGVTVNNGGTLMGPGSITSNVAINSGGTFAPGVSGVSGSATTITGSLAFQSGALYAIALNPVGATTSNISGAAVLAGTVEVSIAPGASLAKAATYDILHSGGLGGTTFAGVAAMPNLATSLSYTTSDVFLTVTAAQLGRATTLNANQQNVANSLNNFFNNGGTLPPAFVNLFGLSGLANALTQISGEAATGTQQTTFDAMNLFMGLMTDPFIAGRGNDATPGASAPTGYASTQNTGAARDAYAMFTKTPLAKSWDPRWSVWAAGFGGSQSTDGNAALGSNSTTSRIAGTAVGADYHFSPFTTAGFALAGGGTSFSVANGGSGHSDLFQAGAFVRHTVGAAYISGALAYGWQDITTNRTVGVAGIDQLQARFNANAFSGRVEGGYRFVSPWTGGIGITPYAAAQFTTFDLPAYAEQVIAGTNNFALAYGARSVTDPRSEVGFRTDKSYVMPDGSVTLRGRLAWAHDYDTDRSIGATFQTLPGASFVVNGAAQASDSVLTTASIERKWTNNWSIAATFEGEFSSVTSSFAGKGAVRYNW